MNTPAPPRWLRRTLPALLLVAGSAALGGCARKPAATAAAKPPEVVVTRPIEWKVTDYEDFTGRTEAYRLVVLKPQVTGAIKAVHFADGDYVHKGDLLFEIDPATYEAQRDNAKAAVKQAEASVVQARASIKQAEARATQFKVSYDLALAGSKTGVTSRDDLNKAEADFAAAVAGLDVAKAALEVSTATLEQNKSLLAIAETKLGYTHITAEYAGRMSKRMVDPGNIVKEDETVLSTLIVLDPIYVSFDIDERTILKLRRLLAEGKITSARESRLNVEVGLADEPGHSFRGPLTFFDNALDQNTGTLRIRAWMKNPIVQPPAVPFVARAMTPGPNPFAGLLAAPAAAAFDPNTLKLLSPGMFVRVRLPVGRPHPGILIPEDALVSNQDRRFVYVIKNPAPEKTDDGKDRTVSRDEVEETNKYKVAYAAHKGTAEYREVEVGPQVELLTRWYEAQTAPTNGVVLRERVVTYRVIEKGVKPGDMVVVTGVQKVRADKEAVGLLRKDPKPAPPPEEKK